MEWIKVTDKLPEVDEESGYSKHVLIHAPDSQYDIDRLIRGVDGLIYWEQDWELVASSDITHWAELVPPGKD